MRLRMLRGVLVPLVLTWLIGAATALTVAYVFTLEAFDRALLDDAHAIAANVVDRGGQLTLDLSERELRPVLRDKSEDEFFAVLRIDGTVVASNATLLPTMRNPGAGWEFADTAYRGAELRMVTLRPHGAGSFSVVVAQTTRGRQDLLQRLVAYSMLPQAALLLWLGWWLRRSLDHELLHLKRLQMALYRRDSTDLTPLNTSAPSLEIERLAQAINELMMRIDRGVQAQREFAGNVAHELRTPLAGIRALAEYGLAQANPEVWQAQLRKIATSQERAGRLVDQLLALALADEARDSLLLRPVWLDEIVRNTLLSYLPRADAQGVDLGAVGLDLPVEAIGHVALIEGALTNLIDNALRYGRPGDGSRHAVTVEVRSEPGGVLMSVSDNGPGIAGPLRKRLLQRWAQGGAGVERGEGAGLGLAIVSRYASLLGGKLTLDAGEGGRGLRATLSLRRTLATPAL